MLKWKMLSIVAQAKSCSSGRGSDCVLGGVDVDLVTGIQSRAAQGLVGFATGSFMC